MVGGGQAGCQAGCQAGSRLVQAPRGSPATSAAVDYSRQTLVYGAAHLGILEAALHLRQLLHLLRRVALQAPQLFRKVELGLLPFALGEVGQILKFLLQQQRRGKSDRGCGGSGHEALLAGH